MLMERGSKISSGETFLFSDMKSCCIGFDKMVNCQNYLNNFLRKQDSQNSLPFFLPLSPLINEAVDPGKFF